MNRAARRGLAIVAVVTLTCAGGDYLRRSLLRPDAIPTATPWSLQHVAEPAHRAKSPASSGLTLGSPQILPLTLELLPAEAPELPRSFDGEAIRDEIENLATEDVVPAHMAEPARCEVTIAQGPIVVQGMPYSAADARFGMDVGAVDSATFVATSDIQVIGAETGIEIAGSVLCASFSILVPRSQGVTAIPLGAIQLYSDGQPADSISIVLETERKQDLRITDIKISTDWPQGKAVPAKVTIHNAGNAPDTVDFHSSSVYAEMRSSKPIIIPADTTVTVDASLHIARTSPLSQSILVRITPAMVGQGTILRGTIRKPVLGSSNPVVMMDIAPWSISGERGGTGIDGALAVNLPADGKLTLRGAIGPRAYMTNVKNSFGDMPWDVRYISPKLKVHAGQITTGEGHIVEKRYRGTGVSANLDIKPLRISAQAIELTQWGDSGRLYGVGVERHLSAGSLRASADAIHDGDLRLANSRLRYQNGRSGHGTIAEVGLNEVTSLTTPERALQPTAHVESGFGVGDGSLRLSTMVRAHSIDDFSLAQHHLDLSATYPLHRRLALSGRATRLVNDSSLLQGANEYQRASFGVSTRLARISISLNANHSKNSSTSDLFGGMSSLRRSLDARLSYNTGGLSLFGTMEVGDEESERNGRTTRALSFGEVGRASANGAYRIGQTVLHAGLSANYNADRGTDLMTQAGADVRVAEHRLRIRAAIDPDNSDRWTGGITTDIALAPARSVAVGIERTAVGEVRFGVMIKQSMGVGLPRRLMDTNRGRVVLDINDNGILDDEDEPVAGVMLRIGDAYVHSDANGLYELPADMPSGLRPEVEFSPGGEAQVGIWRRGDAWDILLAPGATLRVHGVSDTNLNRCVDAGEPSSMTGDVVVSNTSGKRVGGSLRNGSITIRSLAPGTYTVSSLVAPDADGDAYSSVEVQVSPSHTAEIHLSMPTAARPVDFGDSGSQTSCSGQGF